VISRSFAKICGDALRRRFASGVGEHFRRAINAVRRPGRADTLRGFNEQSPRPAANIQDGVAWLKSRRSERALAKLPLTAERYDSRQPVVSARIVKHVAVATVFVLGATRRGVMLVATATRHEPRKPGDDGCVREQQHNHEGQPPVGDMDDE
jgi:hypothetical protein